MLKNNEILRLQKKDWRKIMSIIIGGTYEHYKGNKYKVKGIAKHSETLEKMVVYQALYGNKELWVRPYEMFCERIQKNDEEIPRFKYVGPEESLTCEIQLELPEDLKRTFFEKGLDFEKEIIKNIDNMRIDYKAVDSSCHKKDLALVILASGVSISVILQSIAKLCRVVNERPRMVKQIEKDENGEILRESFVLLEPKKISQKMETDFKIGSNVVTLKIMDENNSDKK